MQNLKDENEFGRHENELGVTLQSKSKFNEHVRKAEISQSKQMLACLRSLRKKQCSQVEIDHLFNFLFLPNHFFRSLPPAPWP